MQREEIQRCVDNDEIRTNICGAAFWNANSDFLDDDEAEILAQTDFPFSLEQTKRCKREQDKMLREWERLEENNNEEMWKAVCSGDCDAVENYYQQGGAKNVRYYRFSIEHSYIMGALRNQEIEMVKLLKGYGEEILPSEEREYDRLMGAAWEQTAKDKLQKWIDEGVILTEFGIEDVKITDHNDKVVIADNGIDFVIADRSASSNEALGRITTFLPYRKIVWLASSFSQEHLRAVRFLERVAEKEIMLGVIDEQIQRIEKDGERR